MILITGASSGIGAATAKLLASQGKDLWLMARRTDRLKAMAQDLTKAHGIQIHWTAFDVTTIEATPHWQDQWTNANRKYLERLEGLVNNAGLAKGLEPAQSADLAHWKTMIDTNIWGLVSLTRLCLPWLIQNRGHVVNIGSVAGHWTYPNGNVYCATKAAVRAFNEGLRFDLLGTGVRVTSIDPGMVETEFSEVRFEDTTRAKKVYQGMTPLTAEDIAEAIGWSMNRPRHVSIQEMVIYPTDQASPQNVHRV